MTSDLITTLRLPFTTPAAASASSEAVSAVADSLLAQLVVAMKPALVCEVGPGRGAFTIPMAQALKGLEKPGMLLAIESWQGNLEDWCDPSLEVVAEAAAQGQGRGVHDFFAAMKAAGVEDIVTPFALQPSLAAQVLDYHGVRPNLVVCHCTAGRGDIVQELNAWLALLGGNGLLVGRDASPHLVPNLRQVIRTFASENNLPLQWAGDWFFAGTLPKQAAASANAQSSATAPEPVPGLFAEDEESFFGSEDQEILIPQEVGRGAGNDSL